MPNRTDPSRQYCRHTVQHKHYNTALYKHSLTNRVNMNDVHALSDQDRNHHQTSINELIIVNFHGSHGHKIHKCNIQWCWSHTIWWQSGTECMHICHCHFLHMLDLGHLVHTKLFNQLFLKKYVLEWD